MDVSGLIAAQRGRTGPIVSDSGKTWRRRWMYTTLLNLLTGSGVGVGCCCMLCNLTVVVHE